MTAAAGACKNHPEKATKRRCFGCKDPICPACTLHRDRHFFCSEACHQRWLAGPQPKRISKKARAKARKARPAAAPPANPAPAPTPILAPAAAAPAPAEPRTERAPIVLRQTAPADPRRWLAVLAFVNVAALAVGLFLAVGRDEPARPDAWASVDALNRVLRAAASRPPAPVLDEAPLDTTAAVMVVTGEAPETVAVKLYLNGKDAGRLRIEAGRFVSDPLPLDFGLNVVQAAAEGEGEPAPLYSLARLVRRLDVPPPVEHSLTLELPAVRDINRGNPARAAVSFTFDGGSEANAATEILDVLRKAGVRTTLFLTGEFIRRYPAVVRRALADGHEIGNHTYSHPHLTTFDETGRHDLRPKVDEDFFAAQLIQTADAYREITGHEMAPFWRAPYGEINPQLLRWAERLGYRHVGWTRRVGKVATLDSLDWVEDQGSHLYLSGAQLKKRFVSLVEAEPDELKGGIFLMHLGTERKADKIHWQLADILAAYRSRGFEILPVSELIR